MATISDINWLYTKYYAENPALRKIVMTHSECVAKKALGINQKKKLGLDSKDIYIAAMLHDIGVVRCNAPDISAFGDKPYLQHGIEGAKILEENGLDKFSRICTTHTGTGLSATEIKEKNLPLPEIDMLPESLLEKLICYSDKFYSKSQDLKREKSYEEVSSGIQKFGDAPLQRFLELHKLFAN